MHVHVCIRIRAYKYTFNSYTLEHANSQLTNTHVHTYGHIQTYLYMQTYTKTYVCALTNMNTCVQNNIGLLMIMHACPLPRTHTYTYAHTRAHTHTYAHTHTHAHIHILNHASTHASLSHLNCNLLLFKFQNATKLLFNKLSLQHLPFIKFKPAYRHTKLFG